MRCPVCQKEVLPGQAVQRMPPREIAEVGPKSGRVGLYPHPQHLGDTEAVVHDTCCIGFFDPESDPEVYDRLMDEAREACEDEIREEVRQEFKDKFDMVSSMIAEGDHEFCVNCWEELADEEMAPEEPPEETMCLWCKKTDQVWERPTPEGRVYCCVRCGKYWDEDEEELAAA